MKINDVDKAYEILKTYKGTNNQIKYYQYMYSKNSIVLKEFDINYILNNYDYSPKTINKIVKVSDIFGKKIQEKYELDFTPEKVKITTIIGEMGDSYHCFLQFRQSIPPKLFYLNKKYILNPLETIDYSKIDIDFNQFDKKTEHLGRKLKALQKEGVKFLLSNKKCILADGMGSGKSVQSIVASICTNADKILIICPASVKSTWKRELMYYVDEKDITIVNGSNWGETTKFTIINYDILDNFYTVPTENVMEEVVTKDENNNIVTKLVTKTKKSTKKAVIEECMKNSRLFQEKFGCVIVDEVHRMVNNKSIRYQIIDDLFKRTRPPFRFLLTGTPMTNKPMNLYYILKLIDAEVTDDYRFYVKRYCGGKEMKLRTGKKILIANDATNLDELKEKIKHVYIRRLLSQMSDMVKKNIEVKEYDLNEKQTIRYNELWDEYVKAQEEKGNNDSEAYRQLVEGTIVRQYLAKEMIPNTIHLAEEIIDNDEKVIISCTYTEEVNELKKYFGKIAVVYDGKMTSKQKDKSEYEFMNNPKIKVFIGQIDSASVGLTLTAATKLIFNSFSFSSHVLKQMEDRIYRLTQTKDVTCYYQVFTDSVSQHVYNTVLKKELMANSIIKSEDEK